MSARERFSKLVELVKQAARSLPRVIGLFSAVVLLYVGYAHVAAIRAREYTLASYAETFDSERALDRFTVIDGRGLRHELRDGALHISGSANAGAATWVVGPVMRLEDVVTASIRYVANMPAEADVVVGFERGDEPSGGLESRRLVVSSSYAIDGDHDAFGARRVWTTRASIPEGSGAVRDPETSKQKDPTRALALQLASYVGRAVATAEDNAIASAMVKWPMGMRVRLVFGVIARHSNANIDVAFQRASYEQSPRPLSVTPFTDRFRAKYVDPRRWTVLLSDQADVTYGSDATGLHIRARSRGHGGFRSAFSLVTPPTPLRSFKYTGQWEVRTLKHAAVLISVVGAGYSPRRFVDMGFFRDDDGALKTIADGHIDGTGQVVFRVGRNTDTSKPISIRYDASSQSIVGTIGLFDRIFDGTFDLHAGENVQLRMLVNLHDAESEADVWVRELGYE